MRGQPSSYDENCGHGAIFCDRLGNPLKNADFLPKKTFYLKRRYRFAFLGVFCAVKIFLIRETIYLLHRNAPLVVISLLR